MTFPGNQHYLSALYLQPSSQIFTRYLPVDYTVEQIGCHPHRCILRYTLKKLSNVFSTSFHFCMSSAVWLRDTFRAIYFWVRNVAPATQAEIAKQLTLLLKYCSNVNEGDNLKPLLNSRLSNSVSHWTPSSLKQLCCAHTK